MNYEEMIINKVMNSYVVFVDNKTAKDRYNKPVIEDYMAVFDNVDNKYSIVSWDENNRILNLKKQ